jgi:hypothetical protein
MNRIILIVFFLFSTSVAFAQEVKIPDTLRLTDLNYFRKIVEKKKPVFAPDHLIFGRPRGDTSELQLFVIGDILATNDTKNFILHPTTIANIHFVKAIDAIHRFGEKAKYGAFIFELKEGTALFDLPELFSYFSIKTKDRALPICLNDDFIAEPSKIYADILAIKKMKVIEGRYWFYTSQIEHPTKYINIITK